MSDSNNRNQVKEMFDLQDTINSLINPDWREEGNNWNRAIIVESVELYEHFGFKWWKKPPELKPTQIHIEVVDIWHFIMSRILENASPNSASGFDTEGASNFVMEKAYLGMSLSWDIDEEHNREMALNSLDYLIKVCSMNPSEFRGSWDIVDQMIYAFIKVCIHSRLTFERLYTLYIGKNALNIFRQKNGYKTGEYIKDWNLVKGEQPIEDNSVLESIIRTHNEDKIEGDGFSSLYDYTLYSLTQYYNKVLAYNNRT